MKKIYLLIVFACTYYTTLFSQITFCENFESYNANDPIAQTSSHWNTWNELMTGTTAPFSDDSNVDTTNASSGTKSLFFPLGIAAGPEDIVLMFDTTQNITPLTIGTLSSPYTTGNFMFSQKMYVRGGTGGGAYFNFQAENMPGQNWALEVAFDAIGTILMSNTSGTSFTATYPFDTWFEIRFEIDLTFNIWEVFIDSVSQGSFSNMTNKIASLDLYPRANDEFYVDDICYTYTPYNALAYDMAAIKITTPKNVALPASPHTISGEIVSLSTNTINSIDINYSVNGAAAVMYTLPGINMSLLDTISFNHTIPWSPPTTGAYRIEIWASNINGGTIDMNTANDIFTDTIHVWNNIIARTPLYETFTSSTCGPCNPGNVNTEAVFAQNPGEYTSIKYQSDFPSVGDPYNTVESNNRRAYYGISSIPRLEIDGGWDGNSNGLNQQIFDTYGAVPAFVNLSANYSINIATKTVEVDVTVDPVENVSSNNLVVHMAIFESITYNNVKTNGETQFEHVMKKMLPDDNGTPITSLIAGTSQTVNQQHEFKGSYRLPPDASMPIDHSIEHSVEDFANLGVAVWVQDRVTKEIHQSTTGNLTNVIAISYNCDLLTTTCIDPGDGTGTYTGTTALVDCEAACVNTGIEEINKEVSVYPNPTTGKLFIENTPHESTLTIFDLRGKEIYRITKVKKEIDISFIESGIYQIKIEGNNWVSNTKLIKQ